MSKALLQPMFGIPSSRNSVTGSCSLEVWSLLVGFLEKQRCLPHWMLRFLLPPSFKLTPPGDKWPVAGDGWVPPFHLQVKFSLKRLQEIPAQALFWESVRIFSPVEKRLLAQQGHVYLDLYPSLIAAKNTSAHCLTSPLQIQTLNTQHRTGISFSPSIYHQPDPWHWSNFNFLPY